MELTTDPYSALVAHLKRVFHLEGALDLLGWDEQVNLPPDSAGLRSRQLADLSELIHREEVRPEVGDWLKALEGDLDPVPEDRACVVREARRDYDRAAKLPAAFVARKAALASEGYHAWKGAREGSDFAAFAPSLRRNLDLAREEADYLGCGGDLAYDYHLDLHDPGMTAASIGALFDELRTGLVPLVERIVNSSIKPAPDLFRDFPVAGQERFLRSVTERLGFDYGRGRLDVAVHPFCGGSGGDTRMTTRYDPDNPLDSLFSSIHETGHGLYEQGLPLEHAGTGLGKAVGMAVHESQSRLWENQVGRGRAFWDYWEPRYREEFADRLAGVSSAELFLAVNAVARTPIRVDADEVTYNLHVLLRFDLEKRLFAGDLEVDDLPAAWNAGAEETLGLTPRNDTEGVLQDVHWSGGGFGYFPSYCLGNMLAAQLWYAALDALPGLEDDFRQGEFGRLLAWLRENVHAHGRRYDTNALAERATGSPLSPRSLLRYLEERYLPLYEPATGA